MEDLLYRKRHIHTYTGRSINVFEFKPEDVDILDIAHSLAMQARFGGHTHEFFSVAQHCIECSRMLPQEHRLAGLLHDAAEAYLVDLPSPIKREPEMKMFRDLEDAIMKVIAERFGFQYPLHEKVKEADQLRLEQEWEHLVCASHRYTWPWQTAEGNFLNEFYSLKLK